MSEPVAWPCSDGDPHGAHFYISAIVGGESGPAPQVTCLCLGKRWVGNGRRLTPEEQVVALAEGEVHAEALRIEMRQYADEIRASLGLPPKNDEDPGHHSA